MKQIGTHELHHAQADAIGDFGAACQRMGTQVLDVMDHITQGETGISIRDLMPNIQPNNTTLVASLTPVDAITAGMNFWSKVFTPAPVAQVVSPAEEETV